MLFQAALERDYKCAHLSALFMFPDEDELLQFGPEDDAVSDLENIPKFVESEEQDFLPKRQFKTAEIADAVMGTEATIDLSDIEFFFPKIVKNYQTGFSPPCDEGQCASPNLNPEGASLNDKNTESSQQVTTCFVLNVQNWYSF